MQWYFHSSLDVPLDGHTAIRANAKHMYIVQKLSLLQLQGFGNHVIYRPHIYTELILGHKLYIVSTNTFVKGAMSFVVLWFKDHEFLLTTVNLLLFIRILKNTPKK